MVLKTTLQSHSKFVIITYICTGPHALPPVHQFGHCVIDCLYTGLVKPPLKRSRSAPDGGDEENQEQLQEQISEGSSIDEEEKTDNTTLLRLLEEGEKVPYVRNTKHLLCSHFYIMLITLERE